MIIMTPLQASAKHVPAKFGCDRSINGGGDVEQMDGRTNPNYNMVTLYFLKLNTYKEKKQGSN